MRQNDHTAILFFSRTPQEEARCKKIVSSRKTLSITRVLRQQVLREARLTGLPLFHCTGEHQSGNSFGERLANAIEASFAKGYERLLVIGNDTPELDKKTLQKARQLLTQDKLVLGPSLDGGVYLIGLTAAAYQRDAFIQLAWEKDQLQDTFTDYADKNALAIVRLLPLTDIDNTLDFWQFLNKLPLENILLVVLKSLLSRPEKNCLADYAIPFDLVDYIGCRSSRAPPAFA